MQLNKSHQGVYKRGNCFGKMYWQQHIDVCFVPNWIMVQTMHAEHCAFCHTGLWCSEVGPIHYRWNDQCATQLSLLICSLASKPILSNNKLSFRGAYIKFTAHLSSSCSQPVSAGRSCPPGDLEAKGQLLSAVWPLKQPAADFPTLLFSGFKLHVHLPNIQYKAILPLGNPLIIRISISILWGQNRHKEWWENDKIISVTNYLHICKFWLLISCQYVELEHLTRMDSNIR